MYLIKFILRKKDADVTICILVYVLKQSVPKLDHPNVTICILVYALKQKPLNIMRLVWVFKHSELRPA